MASGDGIDSIEMESNLSTRNTDIQLSTATKTNSEDDDRDKTSDGRGTSNDVNSDQTLRGAVGAPGVGRYKYDRERKLGHRRIGEGGQITYKKIETSQLMGSIQLGIQHTVGSLASKPKRDLLMMDFWELETISFPPEGSSLTPAHHYSEFRFKIYAPIAFRYFRDLFGIQPDDFMMSMCSSPLRELSNPGASGSIFYLTDDDEFIIKTVQHKEGEFLQKLLPGYYMNLNQNPRTLLPKFFGLYCYQCNSKNIRLIVMNNLLPSYVRMHLKYDLKGSTYNRKANKTERNKKSPTYKDLDFLEQHPNGILLEAETYNALVKTIQRDCRVLESFKIMDYSLLVGVHNLDLAAKEKAAERMNAAAASGSSGVGGTSGMGGVGGITTPRSPRDEESDLEDAPEADQFIAHERDREERERERGAIALNRSRSINRQRLVAHSTAMESIQAESEPIDEEEDVPPGGIPARSENGERLLLFIGIIDILQSYRLKKKLEHTFKSIIHDGDTVSVCRPSFYAQRFQDFMAKTVFRKIPSLDLPEIKGNHRKFRTLVSSYIALKHSPSKRKSLSRTAQRSQDTDQDIHPIAGTSSYHHNNHHSQHHVNSITATSKQSVNPMTVVPQSMSSTPSKPIVTTAPSQQQQHYSSSGGGGGGGGVSGSGGVAGMSGSTPSHRGSSPNTLPPLKQKTGIVKSKVPPPVPPRGSPKDRRGSHTSAGGGGNSGHHGSKSPKGTAPSCSSTPPPAFDDISEGSSSIHRHHHHHYQQQHPHSSSSSSQFNQYQQQQQYSDDRSAGGSSERRIYTSGSSSVRSGTYREDTVSISEIRLDPHLAIDTSGSGSQYGSRGALTWTPPASVEGSTPTWTEGTPSFTESSSSGDMAFSGNSSPLNTSASDRNQPSVEDALNSLTSEMAKIKPTPSSSASFGFSFPFSLFWWQKK